jgi:hypothetical protein
MPTHHLLVEVFHREVAIALAEKLLHALELAFRRTARRYLADPPIAQPFDPFILIANAQPPEVPPRHAQQFAGLFPAQPMPFVVRKRLFKTSHKNLP